jgi:3-deoxy-manno-octulosonate cytidylyltransferase (CMP-KDO synthetase)
MKIIGIIPARFASTRFPGKPLADINGKTMIQRVIEQAHKSTFLSKVIVATDDLRIADHVTSLGETAVLTSPDHPSGTDRCLEALLKCEENYDAVINIQGDEPFVDPSQIDMLADLISRPEVKIATLVKKINDFRLLMDVNKVKVIMDIWGRAIYFSRNAIPYFKGEDPQAWHKRCDYFKHIGLYAYKSSVLKEICALQPSKLELAESLEQLRWIENGYEINAGITEIETPSIDTPEDLAQVLAGMN